MSDESESKKKSKERSVLPKPTTKEEKLKRTQMAILQIEKEFGKGAIMKMGEEEELPRFMGLSRVVRQL